MTLAPLLLASLLAAGPDIELTRLDGARESGALVSVSAESLTFTNSAGEEQSLDTSELRSLTFPAVAPPDPFAEPPAIEVWLTDGSRLACTDFRSQQDNFTLTLEDLGPLSVPRAALRAVRLAPSEQFESRWTELRDRDNKSDLIVVRRQDALDFVEASVGDFGAEDISVLIQNQSRKLPRQRTFGVIFAAPQEQPSRSALQLHLGRSTLQASALALAAGDVDVSLPSQVHWKLPTTHLRTIEFSGRVRLLADLQPVVELPAGVDPQEQYRYFRRGSEPFGAPLKIGADEIITAEGLWVHSGVAVRYRINRDYRRLAAVVGMDHNVAGDRSVQLQILGDDQPLFDEVIRWSDGARDLDLDVAGVRDLEIKVARLPENIQSNIFGIQEHLDLGNIRLIR